MSFLTKLICGAATLIVCALVSAAVVSAALSGVSKTLTVGDEPRSVALGDLNNDSLPDLVTANFSSSKVSVLLATGNGNYGEATDFNAGANSRSVAIADLDGDGFRDLVVGSGGLGIDNTISVLLGDGNGSFEPFTEFTVALEPWSVAIADLNRDTFPDIAAVSGFSNTVSVLPGNGDGSFDPFVSYPVGEYPMSIAIGDLNADSNPDLVTANADDDDVSVLLSDGAGSFDPAVDFPVGNYATSVSIGNLNGDSFPDLAVADQFDDNVSVLINNGSGSFDPRTSFATGDSSTSVAIGDLNADSISDLAVTSGADDDKVSVLTGNGAGSFSAAVDYPVGDNPSSVAIGDLDGDGLNDLAVSNRYSGTASLLLTAPPAGTGTVDPGELLFGARQVGTSSMSKTVTFSNPGSTGLVFDAAGVAGLLKHDFTVEADGCSSSTVPPSGSCQVKVVFSPRAVGPRDADLNLYYGDGKYLNVPMSGTGTSAGRARIGRVDASGPVRMKKGRRASFTVRIANRGNAKATGIRVRATGRGIASAARGGTIAAGKTRRLKIWIRPKQTGRIRLTFKVTSSNAGGRTVKRTVLVTKPRRAGGQRSG